MLKAKLPNTYLEKTYTREDHGFEGIAWSRETLESFLSDPAVNKVVILGGDILKKDKQGRLTYTYDSWAVSARSPAEPYDEYCKRSRDKAHEYLKIMRKGDDIFIAPVLTDEATAGLHAK